MGTGTLLSHSLTASLTQALNQGQAQPLPHKSDRHLEQKGLSHVLVDIEFSGGHRASHVPSSGCRDVAVMASPQSSWRSTLEPLSVEKPNQEFSGYSGSPALSSEPSFHPQHPLSLLTDKFTAFASS